MHNVNLSYITLFFGLFFLFSAYFAKPYIIHTQITLYAMGFTSFMRVTHARTFFWYFYFGKNVFISRFTAFCPFLKIDLVYNQINHDQVDILNKDRRFLV